MNLDSQQKEGDVSLNIEEQGNETEQDYSNEIGATDIVNSETLDSDDVVLTSEQMNNNDKNVDGSNTDDTEVLEQTQLVQKHEADSDKQLMDRPLTDRVHMHHKKRHKRKQPRPRSICETEASSNEEIDEPQIDDFNRYQLIKKQGCDAEVNQTENGIEGAISKEIKYRPLCSTLCIRRERRTKKSPVRKEPTITSKEITEIINATNENTSSPCTTNRYRRHFLKQLRKAEAKRLKKIDDDASEKSQATKKEFDESVKDKSDKLKDDVESEDDFTIDGKRIKIESDSKSEVIECSICHKNFNDVGTFMAHYICHSSFEKEHAGFVTQVKAEGPSVSVSDVGSTSKTSESRLSSSSEFIEESTYFCHVCNQRFNNITSLQAHMTSHPNDTDAGSENKREFYCHLCHKKFASAGSLHVHNKIHTGDNPYTCLKCKKSFRDKTRLTTHIRVHTGEKPFSCNVCYKRFSQKGNLKLHQKIHTGEKDCLCKVCGSCFRLRSDLVRHMKVHGATGIGSNESSRGTELSADENQCSYSSSEDILEQSVRESVAWMTGSSNRSKGSAEEADVKAAIVTGFSGLGLPGPIRPAIDRPIPDLSRAPLPGLKPEEKTLMLSIDSEVEFIKAMTSAKLRATEENNTQTIPCPLCGIVLTSVDNLNHHVLLNHNPLSTFSSSLPTRDLALFDRERASPSLGGGSNKKYYRCNECSVDFSSFPEFQAHMESHSTYQGKRRPRDAKCSICSVLVAPDDLADHLSTHTGEKVYSCAICARVFRRSHHLQTHLRTHTGDRPYICNDCGKCFVRGDHLQNHRRTHTGEKPYKCDVCSKSYSQSHHLLRHKRTHTGERPYRCAMCEKTFSRDHHLKKHMETHKCVIFPDKSEDSKRSSLALALQNHSLHSGSIVTRSSNRIAQMMSSLSTEHTASRLMESMVKRHLQEQEKASALIKIKGICTKDSSSTSTNQSGTETEDKELESRLARPLKISDILDDEIPLGPQISEKLVVDHVLRATRGSLGRVVKQNGKPAVTIDDKDIKSDGKDITCGGKDILCGEKDITDCEKNVKSCVKDINIKSSDRTRLSSLFTGKESLIKSKLETKSAVDSVEEIGNDKRHVRKGTLLTLEDIVNQRLKEEYNLAD